MRYLVQWEIDVDQANSPLQAALQAYKNRNTMDTHANVFTVKENDATRKRKRTVTVDLLEEGEEMMLALARQNFMEFFRDKELINSLTTEDREEVFMNIMQDRQDITPDLLRRLLAKYNVPVDLKAK